MELYDLDECAEFAVELMSLFRDINPNVRADVVGDVARTLPKCFDVSIVVSAPHIDRSDPNRGRFETRRQVICTAASLLGWDERDTSKFGRANTEGYVRGKRVSIHIVNPEDHGAAQFWYSSSPEFLNAINRRAAARGMQMRPTRLVYTDEHRKGARVVMAAFESDIFGALDLDFIPATARDTRSVDKVDPGLDPAEVG